jgi:hypothetical protein
METVVMLFAVIFWKLPRDIEQDHQNPQDNYL